jgi:6-pyruvoyltetrahydropterin/6-carboxytetrahydropterin synthase
VDARTGYLCNITFIDRAVRDRVIPAFQRRWRQSPPGKLICAGLVREAADLLADALPEGVRLVAVALRVTPFVSYNVAWEHRDMVEITQAFEFSAAHRLACADMNDEENRATFGKCANPNGHGHNYMVEIGVTGEPNADSGVVIPIGTLERTVKARVIDVFDHQHLNEDCAEFAELNPSVENITRVIWEKLEGAFTPAKLSLVRVYETPKTWAELRG